MGRPVKPSGRPITSRETDHVRLNVYILLAMALSACAAETATGVGGPTVTVNIAPLDLPGLDLACYDLRVDNGATPAETVIARGDPGLRLDEGDSDTLCSTRFGNGAGGDISYVAPCDAQQSAHTVTLWLDGLYTGTEAAPVLLPDYQDPCPTGCALQTTCQENADTPVTFNITVMRRAQQGFFDIGVDFDNIFCSAKVDCLTDDGQPLTLLHHPDTGLRGQTAVLGLACTAGPGAEGTVLLRDPITMTCGTDVYTLDPAQPEGNVYTPATGANPAPTGSPVWQYAVYAGEEALDCSGEPCNKVYWNVAIGFDPVAEGCTLTTAATAGTPTSLPELTTPEAATWPIIEADVDLTLPGGGLACSSHPLNGTPTGVATGYTDMGPGRAFSRGFDGGAYLSAAPTSPVQDGLLLWLRADAGVQTDAAQPGLVTSWTDLRDGSTARTLAASGTTRPALVIDGGLPALSFDGNNHLGASSGFTGLVLGDATVFIRFRADIESSDNDYLYSTGDSGIGRTMALSRWTNGGPNRFYHYDGTNVRLGVTITSDVWHTSAQIYYGASIPPGTSSHVAWLDGEDANVAATPPQSRYSVSWSNLRVGGWYGAAGFAHVGLLREMIVYDRVLSDAELEQVEAYLATR